MKLEVYQGKSRWLRRPQRWRFRIRAANGKILAVSSESYTNRGDAVDAAYTAFGLEED